MTLPLLLLACVGPQTRERATACSPLSDGMPVIWDEVVACRASSFTTRLSGADASGRAPGRFRAWIDERNAVIVHDDTQVPFTSLVVDDVQLGRYALTISPEPSLSTPTAALITLTLLPEPAP